MSGKHIVFIVLAIIAVLFVVGLAATNKSKPSSNRDAADRPFLKSLFGGAGPKLDFKRMQTNCRQGRAFVFEGSCVVNILGEEGTRYAKLNLAQGLGSVQITYEPHPADRPEGYDDPGSQQLGADGVALTVFERGGTLRLECVGTCRVNIE